MIKVLTNSIEGLQAWVRISEGTKHFPKFIFRKNILKTSQK
jgi:hypothetical protein